MTIEAKRDEKRFKVMIDNIQRGISVTSPIFANALARKIKETDYPKARLILLKI